MGEEYSTSALVATATSKLPGAAAGLTDEKVQCSEVGSLLLKLLFCRSIWILYGTQLSRDLAVIGAGIRYGRLAVRERGLGHGVGSWPESRVRLRRGAVGVCDGHVDRAVGVPRGRDLRRREIGRREPAVSPRNQSGRQRPGDRVLQLARGIDRSLGFPRRCRSCTPARPRRRCAVGSNSGPIHRLD